MICAQYVHAVSQFAGSRFWEIAVQRKIIPGRMRSLFLLLLSAFLSAAGLVRVFVGRATNPSVLGISGKATSQRLAPEGVAQLHSKIDALQATSQPGTVERKLAETAAAVYSSLGDSLAWSAGNQPTPQAWQMIEELKHAEEKGLRPEDYEGQFWDGRIAIFSRSPACSEEERIAFDVALTVSTLRFITHLHAGRVHAGDLRFALANDTKVLDAVEFLQANLLRASDVRGAVESVEPQFLAYRRTVDALHNYLELVRKEDGEQLPASLESIRTGDSHPSLPQLRRRLQLLGNLDPSTGTGDLVYDRGVESAVAHFQSRHGLDPNGTLDRDTLTQLNTPLRNRVLQLQLTLERWRWLPQTFTEPPVVVNIPEFRLYAIREDHRVALAMNVIAGRAYRHETPVFTSAIRSVVVRPFWNVPLNIQREELLPELENDPGYLADHDFEIVDARDQTPVAVGDLAERNRKLHSGQWLLRQKPGPENSLGLLKFELPNRYDIYLHGTPAQELFAKSRRDFSHGCIRVENPIALVMWVLRNDPEWTEERIRSAMNGESTLRVSVKHPVPVWILYGTAVVREDGEVHFLKDIYGHDAALQKVLEKLPVISKE
jgi:L,D-transpeptidase YcbB